jgi:hypothetical protein
LEEFGIKQGRVEEGSEEGQGSSKSVEPMLIMMMMMISSSHGGEYDVQNCLLGCTAV